MEMIPNRLEVIKGEKKHLRWLVTDTADTPINLTGCTAEVICYNSVERNFSVVTSSVDYTSAASGVLLALTTFAKAGTDWTLSISITMASGIVDKHLDSFVVIDHSPPP